MEVKHDMIFPTSRYKYGTPKENGIYEISAHGTNDGLFT
jgi:hypothetical protein